MMDEEEIHLNRIDAAQIDLYDAAEAGEYRKALDLLNDIKVELAELILLDQTRDT